MKLFEYEKDCCGCTACESICPKHAIYLKKNIEGFLYPFIDRSLCVDCGLCKKVCDFQSRNNTIEVMCGYPQAWAVKHKKKEVIQCSTSGGAFTAISDYVLRNSGVVYGAILDDDFDVKHSRAVSESERNAFRGSKYVQSDLEDIFASVKQDLEKGRMVLFTGTPCQCSGLKSFLQNAKQSTERLILCDIVCHGTPSPLLWRKHIESIKKRYKKPLIDYQFRAKINGWHNHTEVALFKDGKSLYASSFIQKHKNLFYSHLTLRESCYNCKYTTTYRNTDITIADFWGIEKIFPDWDDDTGISLILVNNKKGSIVFDGIQTDLECRKVELKDCLQPQLQHPASRPDGRDKFWQEYYQHGYDYVIHRYTNCNFKDNSYEFTTNVLRRTGLMKIVKKIIRKR